MSGEQSLFDFTANQRWRSRRDFYRPAGEPIRTQEYGVERITYGAAKVFCTTHHYSGSFVANIASYGLFHKSSPFEASRLVGVASFSPGSNPCSIATWTGFNYTEGAELGRFVLLEEVPGNGESFFLAAAFRAFKTERPETKCVLSYSDPVPRTNADGVLVMPGHRGTIYQATNAIFAGRGASKQLLLSRDGRAVAQRIFSKIRNGEIGRAYSTRLLAEVTGVNPLPEESPAEFVRRAKETLRSVFHPGNYLFIFPLAADRREKTAILNSPRISEHRARMLPYPKHVERAA